MIDNLTITLTDGRRLGYAEFGDPQGRPIFFSWSTRQPNPRYPDDGFLAASDTLGKHTANHREGLKRKKS